MRIKIVTTITSYIETRASLAEARTEILGRLHETEQYEDACEDVITAQDNAVVFDEVIKTSTEVSVIEDV